MQEKREEPKPIAIELAKKQREISISEFFLKNRHLLGFDNPSRALMMVVKEAVDNSLDACSDIKVLPEIRVQIDQLAETRFKVTVEDNGPGIVKQQIPNIFAKLLYGSKFHTMKQSMGQQGIGISAAVLYSQLTTGKSAKITSKIDPRKKAHYYELQIDTKTNEPRIIKEEEIEWQKDRGTKIELEIEAKYLKGKQSVDEYIRQISLVNPHANLIYRTPEKEKIEYKRVTEQLPKEAKEIKPHPYGIELGQLMKMLQDTRANTLQGFFQNDFSRVGATTAKEICDKAGIKTDAKPHKIVHHEVEKIFKAIQEAKIMNPQTDCLSPIGEELLLKSLQKEIKAEFYTAITRPPSVYRGMPFQIEIAIAYNGELPKEETIKLLRFANKVPLLYQQGACAITEAVEETNWKAYGLQQSGSNLPAGPAIILVHMASVWVPFTSEAKEAIAHYEEIIKEIKLALQEAGRELGLWIRKNIKKREQEERVNLFERYIPELANSLSNLTNVNRTKIEESFKKILKKGLNELIENGQTTR